MNFVRLKVDSFPFLIMKGKYPLLCVMQLAEGNPIWQQIQLLQPHGQERTLFYHSLSYVCASLYMNARTKFCSPGLIFGMSGYRLPS
jgi:hypothetical protein